MKLGSIEAIFAKGRDYVGACVTPNAHRLKGVIGCTLSRDLREWGLGAKVFWYPDERGREHKQLRFHVACFQLSFFANTKPVRRFAENGSR